MGNENEGVLGRWSRRKRAAVVSAECDTELQMDAAAAEASVEFEVGSDEAVPLSQTASDLHGATSEPSEERMLTEEDLPDIDSLSYGSDFSAFLQKNVPDYLHKLALRKLWTSNPVLANVDGLNDYDLDYTIKEMMEIAAQSAEDLARGAKRLNVVDLRAQEREARRMAAVRPEAAAPAAAAIEAQDNNSAEQVAQLEPLEDEEALAPKPQTSDS